VHTALSCPERKIVPSRLVDSATRGLLEQQNHETLRRIYGGELIALALKESDWFVP
jgi:hypothetical protein